MVSGQRPHLSLDLFLIKKQGGVGCVPSLILPPITGTKGELTEEEEEKQEEEEEGEMASNGRNLGRDAC